MSVTQPLKASARAAYRDLYRAASSTFQGDESVLDAFRQKMRQDAMLGQEITDLEQYQKHVQHTYDMAQVLRKNIVQGVKVAKDSHSGVETWRLNVRPETELGSNDSIKDPASPSADLASSRTAKKREKSVNSQTLSSPSVPMYYSALKRAHQKREIPVLREEDLEESFVRGSGPGGQSINKTENNVQLLHKPTGIRVSCQETRSLSTNRKLARRLLVEKLDKLQNPGLSKRDLEKAKQRERERRRRKKAKNKFDKSHS